MAASGVHIDVWLIKSSMAASGVHIDVWLIKSSMVENWQGSTAELFTKLKQMIIVNI